VHRHEVNTIPGKGFTVYVIDMISQQWRSAAEVDRVLACLELVGFADRLPASLHRAWRHRVGLARAWVLDPEVLFLDDLQWVDEATVDLLGQMVTNLGRSILFVICAFRDGPLEKRHPLRSLIAMIEEEKILEALGNPHREVQFIHIGGTNGKGSTVGSYVIYGLQRNGVAPKVLSTKKQKQLLQQE
jgi:ABC-type transport system involved in cytochrome c biogenesis ATPase subunit